MRQSNIQNWFKPQSHDNSAKAVDKVQDDATVNTPSIPLCKPPPEGIHVDTSPSLKSSLPDAHCQDHTYGKNQHPNIHCIPCPSDRISEIKRLNTLLLPMSYPRSFYRDLASTQKAATIFAFLAIHEDEIPSVSASLDQAREGSSANPTARTIAAITGNLSDDGKDLYIRTLCTLSPYRGLGAASLLLERMIEETMREHAITCVSAHAWTGDQDVIDWYIRRGFYVDEHIDSYFANLNPSSGVLIRKAIK